MGWCSNRKSANWLLEFTLVSQEQHFNEPSTTGTVLSLLTQGAAGAVQRLVQPLLPGPENSRAVLRSSPQSRSDLRSVWQECHIYAQKVPSGDTAVTSQWATRSNPDTFLQSVPSRYQSALFCPLPRCQNTSLGVWSLVAHHTGLAAWRLHAHRKTCQQVSSLWPRHQPLYLNKWAVPLVCVHHLPFKGRFPYKAHLLGSYPVWLPARERRNLFQWQASIVPAPGSHIHLSPGNEKAVLCPASTNGHWKTWVTELQLFNIALYLKVILNSTWASSRC